MLLRWLICCLASVVTALPDINLQVNAQVPPVARLSEAYDFTFASSTFLSSQGPLSYSLLNQPSWLRLDNVTRKFYGTPTKGDIGSSEFQLLATDLSGTSQMDVVLVTLNGPPLQPVQSVLSQLAQFGQTSDADTLLLYPLQSFSFAFTRQTFSSSMNDISYYATTDDASPLPSWLQFASQELRFFGMTPSLVSPDAEPQVYGIKLYASRIAGFAEATVTFHMIIGYHMLAFQNPSVDQNASQGGVFSVSLRDQLYLDGNRVQNTDLRNISASVPDWIAFDKQSISFSGMVPTNADNTSMSVTAVDIYGDQATAVVSVAVLKLFNRPLPIINATIGQPLIFTVTSDFLRFAVTTVSANLGALSSWLQYDADSRTLQGTVPEDISPEVLKIGIHATKDTTTDDEILEIRILRGLRSSSVSIGGYTSTEWTRSTTETSTSDSSASAMQGRSGNGRKTLVLALAIVLPVICSMLACALSLTCWKRKRARRAQREYFEKRDTHTRLVAQELDAEDFSKEPQESLSQPVTSEERSKKPTAAPHVELPWTDSSDLSQERLSKVLRSGEHLTAVVSSPGLVANDATNSQSIQDRKNKQIANSSEQGQHFPSGVQQQFNFSRKRLPFKSWQSRIENSRISKRYSRPTSGFSTSNFGLPTRRSGAGHGSGGPAGFNEVRQSWQFTASSMTSEDSRVLSAALDRFPHPPLEINAGIDREISELGRNQSMRLVDSNNAYAEFLRNRRRNRDFEPSARFSTMNSSRRFSDRRALNAYLRSSRSVRSHSETGGYSTGDSANWRQTGISLSSSEQPDLDPTLLHRSASHRLSAAPFNVHSEVSAGNSGRFSSIESISDSEWEDELLVESHDPDGQKRWYTSEVLPEGASSRLTSLEYLRRNSQGQREPLRARNTPMPPIMDSGQGSAQAVPPPQGREWKLGDSHGRQPVSVVEGQMQRSQGSEKGDLAFI
ncbi:MAG: hypothetical protein Q9160_004010 [Pyrenula sp. 1 TL-2023]